MFSDRYVTVSETARSSHGHGGFTPYDALLTYRQGSSGMHEASYNPNSYTHHLSDLEFYSSGSSYATNSHHSGRHHQSQYHSRHHTERYHQQARQDYHSGYAAERGNSSYRAHYGSTDLLSTGLTSNHAPTRLGLGIAHVAEKVAYQLGTVGDCARGPRLTFGHFGLHLPAVVATQQGEILERTGLFKEVSRSEVKPGDYGYRHWTPHVIKQHGGVDKGDSFIVASVGRRGQLVGANDHRFIVPGDGSRYQDTRFLRPTEEFYKLYGGRLYA